MQACISEAIETCARDLPEGWKAVIEVERGASTITLLTPGGTKVIFPSNYDTGITGQLQDLREFLVPRNGEGAYVG